MSGFFSRPLEIKVTIEANTQTRTPYSFILIHFIRTNTLKKLYSMHMFLIVQPNKILVKHAVPKSRGKVIEPISVKALPQLFYEA